MKDIAELALGSLIILVVGWLLGMALSLPLQFMLGGTFVFVTILISGILQQFFMKRGAKLLAAPMLAAALHFGLIDFTDAQGLEDLSPRMQRDRDYRRSVVNTEGIQVIRDTAIGLAVKLDHDFPHMISTSVRISSGSIQLGIEIMAISRELLPRYDEFVKRVNAISTDIADVFRGIAMESAENGDPLYKLQQEVIIEPRAKLMYGFRPSSSRPVNATGAGDGSSMQQNLNVKLPTGCIALLFVLVLVLSGVLTLIGLYLSNHLWIGFVP